MKTMRSRKAGLYLGRGRQAIPDSVHHWMVYCLNLNTGDLIWKKEAHAGKPKVPRHPKNSYAAETPTTDGKRLYVLFGDLGLYCFDFDGKSLWDYPIEPKETLFGYGRRCITRRPRRSSDHRVRQSGGFLHCGDRQCYRKRALAKVSR